MLILGATGFIGRWIANKLSALEANNFLVVRSKSTALDIFQRYQIKGEIIEADLMDEEMVSWLVNNTCPSIVFNLAGYGVDRDERDENHAKRINADLVRRLCSAISTNRDPNWNGQDLVHVGSALEYGAINGDLSEDSMPKPTTLYGISKLMGTQYLSQWTDGSRLKAFTARLFTVYGPGEHAGRLLPYLIAAAGSDEALQLTDGYQKRDFTYVEDVVEGLLRLGGMRILPWHIINLATGKLIAVRQFVKIAAKTLGISPDRLRFGSLPTRDEEMEHAPVRVDRLRSLLRWSPNTGLQEGIRKTWLFERSIES